MKNFGKIINVARNNSKEGLDQTLDIVKEVGGLEELRKDVAIMRLFPIIEDATNDGEAATAIFCCLNGHLFVMNDKTYATPGAFPEKLIDCILVVAEDGIEKREAVDKIDALIDNNNFDKTFKDFDRVLCDDVMEQLMNVIPEQYRKKNVHQFSQALYFYLTLNDFAEYRKLVNVLAKSLEKYYKNQVEK